MSSESKAGGLVAKWRTEAQEFAGNGQYDSGYGWGHGKCADELEAALSAHGQPVVDAELMKRVLGAPYDGVTVGDFFVYADFSEHDTLGVVRAIVTAALGDTP